MSDRNDFSRRKFVSAVSASGMALAGGKAMAAPQDGGPETSNGELRIGCLNVGVYSHLPPVWAAILNPRQDKQEIAFTRMRITHCWDIEPDKAQEFAKEFDCTAVKNFDDMLGKVDGIISGGYYNHPWNHILHQPYLEAGLPNLINRPLSNSMAMARRIIEMAQKHNAPVLVPSAHEHNEAIQQARAWITGKKILCYEATNSFDDYPTHGIHGLYLVCRAVAETGHPVISVSYRAESWHKPPGVLILEHKDGDGRTFYGTLHQVSGSWGTIRLHTPEAYGGKGFEIFPGTEYPYNRTETWAPTLWAFERMAAFGEMPQKYEDILHKHAVFMTGWLSILERNGAPVRLDEVPEDWEAPVTLPNHPEDNIVALFKQKFGS